MRASSRQLSLGSQPSAFIPRHMDDDKFSVNASFSYQNSPMVSLEMDRL